MLRFLNATARFVCLDLLGSVFRFPVWWYSDGLARLVRAVLHTLAFRARAYGFAVWIKNFFVPMYGQTDLAGRLVSIFMRGVVLVGRALAFAGESLLWLAALLLWFLTPLASLAFFCLNFFARVAP